MQDRPKKIQAGVYTFLGYTLQRSRSGWFARLDEQLAARYPTLQPRFPENGMAKTRDELLPQIALQHAEPRRG